MTVSLKILLVMVLLSVIGCPLESRAGVRDTHLLMVGGGDLTGLDVFRDKTVLIICWASQSYPLDNYETIRRQLLKAGARATYASLFPPVSQAEVESFLALSGKVDGVSLSGGDQLRLVKPFIDFPVLGAELNRHFQKGDPVEGSSAGAAAMPQVMITGDRLIPAKGLGLLANPEIRVDTHFDERNREKRLLEFMKRTHGTLGIGLGKHTGIFIQGGSTATVTGPAQVVFYRLSSKGVLLSKESLSAGETFCLLTWKKGSDCFHGRANEPLKSRITIHPNFHFL